MYYLHWHERYFNGSHGKKRKFNWFLLLLVSQAWVVNKTKLIGNSRFYTPPKKKGKTLSDGICEHSQSCTKYIVEVNMSTNS